MSQLFLCIEYRVENIENIDGVLVWFDLILNERQSKCLNCFFVENIASRISRILMGF